jgi:hypothetical protein
MDYSDIFAAYLLQKTLDDECHPVLAFFVAIYALIFLIKHSDG